MAQPRQLFVAADGPRVDRDGEAQLCEESRRIIDKVDWPCEVRTLFREQNLGCREAVSGAISWFFENVEEGIILEDDCVPHPSFFPYCEALLCEYVNDKRVLSIGGSNFGYTDLNSSSYGFTSFMNMWGWATWADRANGVDYAIQTWGLWRSKFRLLRSLRRGCARRFWIDYSWYRYWAKLFTDTKSGKINTWDYQWSYFALMNDLVTVFPKENLISNIGYGASATHTHASNDPLAEMGTSPLKPPFIKPIEIVIDSNFYAKCIQHKWNRHEPSIRNDIKHLKEDSKNLVRSCKEKLRKLLLGSV